ncbi:MAG TPA: ATP-binding cassette domain-containing protein [Ignavibacteria bacterium]
MDVKDIILEIKNVKKSFGSFNVISNVSLSVSSGETIVILGKSGTGKSVILKCIIGLLEPDEGTIEVFGKNLFDLKPEELKLFRKKLGFLFQSGALYDSMTVRENLIFPVERHLEIKDMNFDEKTEEVLTSVGLLDAIDKMPSELSGGMKKRVGLARTLMLEPEIILYDEPTTGLDPATSKEISELIINMQKKYKVTSLIVTHDIACAKLVANRIVILNDGVFYKEGTYEELSASDDDFIKGFFQY